MTTIILSPSAALLLVEALKDAGLYRAALAVARPVLGGGGLADLDADADAAAAYLRLKDEVLAVADVHEAELRLDPGRALLAADAFSDGAAYVALVNIVFTPPCESCVSRARTYADMETRIRAVTGGSMTGVPL